MKKNEFELCNENESSFHISVSTKNLGKTFTKWPEAKGVYFYSRDIERTDPDLIVVVKKLKNKANGDCAELKVVEIPDDIDYVIEDYDGIETVEEKHRSW
jgi:hypothetical protein